MTVNTTSPNPRLTYYPAYLTEGKIWYITFYVECPYSGKMIMKRIKVNRIKSIPERRKYARNLVKELNIRLANGWNPIIEDTKAKHFHTLASAVETYKKTKYKELEANSIRSYESYLKKLTEYIEHIDQNMYCISFDKDKASEFMLWIKEDPKIGNRTYNNYLKYYQTFFMWMQEVNYISINPFRGLPKVSKKLTKKNRKYIPSKELNMITDYLAKHNPRFLAASMLMYYCCLRNGDLCYLKPSSFDMKNKLININADETKNDNDSKRVIPKALEKYLDILNIENTPRDWYLFSGKNYTFDAGKEQLNSRYFSKYWSDKIRPALKLPMNLQFYSLKDTGITNLLSDGVSPAAVQGQADHSSLEVTTQYVHTKTPAGFKQLRDLAKDIEQVEST